jgi:hypothetical protein
MNGVTVVDLFNGAPSIMSALAPREGVRRRRSTDTDDKTLD